jgi:hypothetical protein
MSANGRVEPAGVGRFITPGFDHHLVEGFADVRLGGACAAGVDRRREGAGAWSAEKVDPGDWIRS